MEYNGKLYGKIGCKFFDTGYSAEDFDRKQNDVDELVDFIKDIYTRLDVIQKTNANKLIKKYNHEKK